MKGARSTALVLLAHLLLPGLARSQTLPRLQNSAVRVQVEHTADGYFRYKYRVSSIPSEILLVTEFAIDVATGDGRTSLDTTGLPPNAPAVLATTRLEREKTTDKAVALSISQVPPEWAAGVGEDLRVRWRAAVSSGRLGGGGQLDSLEISSHAPPGIRDARLQPDLNDFLPDIEDPSASLLYDQIPASAQIIRTVGPTAPPVAFVPRAFADEIEVMVNEARAQGWIATDEAKTPLLDSLAALKTALEANDFNDARSAASGFIAQVNLNGCGVFSCGGNQAISSEGYALLRYNMEYLRDRIPTTIRTTVIESDEDLDSFIVDEVIRAEGSIGDQDGTSLAELTLVQDFAGPARTAQFAYPSNVVVPFVFSFDGRAAKIDVGGGGRVLRTESIIYPVTVAPENLFIRAGAAAASSSVSVTGLVLDGEPIADTVVANSAESGLAILRIEASDLDDGFTLAGNVTMSWSGEQPSGSDLSVQLRAADVISGPD